MAKVKKRKLIPKTAEIEFSPNDDARITFNDGSDRRFLVQSINGQVSSLSRNKRFGAKIEQALRQMAEESRRKVYGAMSNGGDRITVVIKAAHSQEVAALVTINGSRLDIEVLSRNNGKRQRAHFDLGVIKDAPPLYALGV